MDHARTCVSSILQSVNQCQDFPLAKSCVIIHQLNENQNLHPQLNPAQWTRAHLSALRRHRRKLCASSYLFSAPELQESVTQQKPNFGGTRIPVRLRLHVKQVDRAAVPGLAPDFGLSYPRNATNHASPASTIPSPLAAMKVASILSRRHMVIPSRHCFHPWLFSSLSTQPIPPPPHAAKAVE